MTPLLRTLPWLPLSVNEQVLPTRLYLTHLLQLPAFLLPLSECSTVDPFSKGRQPQQVRPGDQSMMLGIRTDKGCTPWNFRSEKNAVIRDSTAFKTQ